MGAVFGRSFTATGFELLPNLSNINRIAVLEEKNKAKAFTHSSNQWEEESSSCAGTDVSDWQDKTCGHALLVCFMRERQVSLGHADRKVPKTLRRKEREEKNVLTVVLCLYLPCVVAITKGLTLIITSPFQFWHSHPALTWNEPFVTESYRTDVAIPPNLRKSQFYDCFDKVMILFPK